MIQVMLMGGLGNQMFQYAIGRSLSLRYNKALYLDLSSFNSISKGITPREFELDRFHYKGRLINGKNINFTTRKFNKALYRLGTFWQKPVHKSESFFFNYDRDIFNSGKNLILEGYWQCPDYFLDFEKQIREDLTFKNTLTGRNKQLRNMIQNTDAVSVHVRRTDYIVEGKPWICNLDYYKKAIGQLTADLSRELSFFVFSDDADWAKKNLQINDNTYYIDWNKGNNSFIDMQLMSSCDHHIIANSSFSWWGAWLNPSKSKTVYAPAVWTHSPEIIKYNICPEGWCKIVV